MEDLVKQFQSFINLNWNKPLNKSTCIPRETRKLIRDLLREYIKNAPDIIGDNPSGRPLNLFYKIYVVKNPVYQKLFENNIWLLQSAENIKDFKDMGTIGRFLLMVVYRIMVGGISNGGTIMDSYGQHSSKAAIDTQMDYFCYNFMWYMASISNYYRNNSLVFGIPMYWWRKEQKKENILDKLNESFSNNTHSRGAVGFVQFMIDSYNNMDKVSKINITFDKYSTNFVSTVTEFILDGLCYTVWDDIRKQGTEFYVDVFLNVNSYKGAFFKRVGHLKQGVIDGIKRPTDVDCGALRVLYHPSFSRRIMHGEHIPMRKKPRSMEDTHAKQHDVNDKSNKLHTRNHENNGYYLDFEHYSSVYDEFINNELERRDRLTYNSCVQHRFLGDVDNDKSTYRLMLRDRFMGYLDIKTEPPKKDDSVGTLDPRCMDLDRLERLIKPLEDSIKTNSCCNGTKREGNESSPKYTNNIIVTEIERPLNIARPHRPSSYIFPYGEYGNNRHYSAYDAWWRGRHGAIW